MSRPKMNPDDIPHGGNGSSYTYHGCRCEQCKAANARRIGEQAAARKLAAKDPNDPRHGTASFYRNHGCRCGGCTKANSAKWSEYMKQKAK